MYSVKRKGQGAAAMLLKARKGNGEWEVRNGKLEMANEK